MAEIDKRTAKRILRDGPFDRNLVDSFAGTGIAELQNGKGDFFNDLLALLLENCPPENALQIAEQVRASAGTPAAAPRRACGDCPRSSRRRAPPNPRAIFWLVTCCRQIGGGPRLALYIRCPW